MPRRARPVETSLFPPKGTAPSRWAAGNASSARKLLLERQLGRRNLHPLRLALPNVGQLLTQRVFAEHVPTAKREQRLSASGQLAQTGALCRRDPKDSSLGLSS